MNCKNYKASVVRTVRLKDNVARGADRGEILHNHGARRIRCRGMPGDGSNESLARPSRPAVRPKAEVPLELSANVKLKTGVGVRKSVGGCFPASLGFADQVVPSSSQTIRFRTP